MASSIQGDAAKIKRALDTVTPKARPAEVANDPRPERDNISLAFDHKGSPLQTATRARGIPDVEVRFRAALRDFLRDGTDFSAAERAFKGSGASDKDVARIESEEASSFFRMSRDEFHHIGGEHGRLSAAFGPSPTPQQAGRLADLKGRARAAFDGANRADQILGGLDPQRGWDLEKMEAELLEMGFPKDEVHITSRPAGK